MTFSDLRKVPPFIFLSGFAPSLSHYSNLESHKVASRPLDPYPETDTFVMRTVNSEMLEIL